MNTNLFGKDGEERKGAHVSEDWLYRYALWRVWDDSLPLAVFIGLNPSTADAAIDDPTIKKCRKFARSWGYGGLWMLNLFAFRATEPKDMMAAADPVGRQNDAYLQNLPENTGIVIAAWGANGSHRGRDKEVRRFLPQLHCLRVSTKGQPWHPLYIPDVTKPYPFD